MICGSSIVILVSENVDTNNNNNNENINNIKITNYNNYK